MARIFAATSDLTWCSTWWCDQLEHRHECMQDLLNISWFLVLVCCKKLSCKKDRGFIVHLKFQVGYIINNLTQFDGMTNEVVFKAGSAAGFFREPLGFHSSLHKEIWEVVVGAILTPKPTPQLCAGCLQPGSTGETWPHVVATVVVLFWSKGQGVASERSAGVWYMLDDLAGWNRNDQPTNIQRHRQWKCSRLIDMSKTFSRFTKKNCLRFAQGLSFPWNKGRCLKQLRLQHSHGVWKSSMATCSKPLPGDVDGTGHFSRGVTEKALWNVEQTKVDKNSMSWSGNIGCLKMRDAKKETWWFPGGCVSISNH